MRISILLFLLFFTSCVTKRKCYENVYFSDISILMGRDYGRGRMNKLDRRVRVRLDNNTIAQIVLHECHGKANVWMFSRKKIISEGSYISSDYLSTDILRIKDKDYSIDYYVPIKDGVWKFYDAKVKIAKVEFWTKGILDSVVIR